MNTIKTNISGQILNSVITHIAGELYNNCEIGVGEQDGSQTVAEILRKHALYITAIDGNQITAIGYVGDDDEIETFALTI